MKKSCLIGLLTISMLISCEQETIAAVDTDIPKEVSLISTDFVQLLSIKLEYRYRTYQGRLQYRRWNITQNKWYDLYWINV